VSETAFALRQDPLEHVLLAFGSNYERLLSLRTPLVAEPFKGKAAIRPVVEALLGIVDKFEFLEMMQGPEHVSEFFRVTIGSIELDGMDYWRLNEAGLIQEMTVLW
jgi:hypothetical protein